MSTIRRRIVTSLMSPYEDYCDIIDSTPDMEVYFTWVKSGILTGWVEEAGEWYFYDETGEKVTGLYY